MTVVGRIEQAPPKCPPTHPGGVPRLALPDRAQGRTRTGPQACDRLAIVKSPRIRRFPTDEVLLALAGRPRSGSLVERDTASKRAFSARERRGRDSNPRWTNHAHNGFRDDPPADAFLRSVPALPFPFRLPCDRFAIGSVLRVLRHAYARARLTATGLSTGTAGRQDRSAETRAPRWPPRTRATPRPVRAGAA